MRVGSVVGGLVPGVGALVASGLVGSRVGWVVVVGGSVVVVGVGWEGDGVDGGVWGLEVGEGGGTPGMPGRPGMAGIPGTGGGMGS
ncbi:hypothetical protein ALI22I_26315 [Saccharothrix sp. ALI-22-I]|nr:hypothetical protein ALI22I_26315 [Saccharothrix sp. ALI-22-I]